MSIFDATDAPTRAAILGDWGREGFVEAARSDGSDNDEGLPDIRPDIRLVWRKDAP